MKNYSHLIAVTIIVFAAGFGCSFISGDSASTPADSNKTITDKAVDTTVGKSRIGIGECDQVMDAIEAELNNPDDGFAVKAAKAVVLNRFRDSIRESFEQNPNDKEALVKTCLEIKTQFDNYKANSQSAPKN